MSRISWGSSGSKTYETGIDRGVFYPQQGPGIPWNGLVNVKEDPAGSDLPAQYIDGVSFRSQKTKEGFAAVLQAYTCPREFEEYDGTTQLSRQQRRKVFGLSYRTRIGDDISGTEHAYKIHLVYNALAMPSPVDYSTTNNSGPNATPFSWGISTSPIKIPGIRPAAHFIIDTSIAYPSAVKAVEDVLYGIAGTEARLPTPQELLDIFEENAILIVIDHGDGTWTAIGPDSAIKMLDPITFQITWPSAIFLDSDSYQISSL